MIRFIHVWLEPEFGWEQLIIFEININHCRGHLAFLFSPHKNNKKNGIKLQYLHGWKDWRDREEKGCVGWTPSCVSLPGSTSAGALRAGVLSVPGSIPGFAPLDAMHPPWHNHEHFPLHLLLLSVASRSLGWAWRKHGLRDGPWSEQPITLRRNWPLFLVLQELQWLAWTRKQSFRWWKLIEVNPHHHLEDMWYFQELTSAWIRTSDCPRACSFGT